MRKHGLAGTPIYQMWSMILQRCLNKKNKAYKNYGGRGIKLCKKWLQFEIFYKEFGQFRPVNAWIERVDNNGNYSLKNCIWSNRAEQQKNKRQTVWVSLNGQIKCCRDWGRIYKVAKTTALYRLHKGWTPEETFLLQKKRSKNGG